MSLLKLSLIVGFAVPIISGMFSLSGSATPPVTPPGSTTALIPPWFAFKIGCKLHEFFSTMAFATQPPEAYVLDMSTAYWNSEVTYALAFNKVFDAVQAEKSATCEAIAEKLELQAYVLCRYMEVGKNIHLLARDESTKEFSLTPHGSLLTVDGGLRDFLLMINGKTKNAWRTAGTQLIKEGGGETRKSPWEMHYGVNIWDHFKNHPEEEAEFGRAMKSLSAGPSGALIMDWIPPSEDAVLCDMGGGVGSLIGEVLLHYPKMKGIVFDQPPVAKQAIENFASMGLADRTSAVGGSFFEELPAELSECDAFIMRFILHDWPDDENVKILENIRAVASKTDKKKVVVVMDQIIETGAPSFLEAAKSFMTINMISCNPYGSRERSIPEHIDLFQEAGYDKLDVNGGTNTKVIPTRSIFTLFQVEI